MHAYQEQIKNLYLGILCNYPDFSEEADAHLTYDFSAGEWEELNFRYQLERIARFMMNV